MNLDPMKSCFKQILFDETSHVQKAGIIKQSCFPQTQVCHGMDHVVSLIMGRFVLLPGFQEYSKFAKMVINNVVQVGF